MLVTTNIFFKDNVNLRISKETSQSVILVVVELLNVVDSLNSEGCIHTWSFVITRTVQDIDYDRNFFSVPVQYSLKFYGSHAGPTIGSNPTPHCRPPYSEKIARG